VRPGHRPKAGRQVGLFARRAAVPVGRADQEPRLAHAIVAPLAEQGGEVFR